MKLSLPPKTCKRPSKIVILLIIALVLVLTSTIVLAVLLAQEKKNDTNGKVRDRAAV